MGMYNEVYKRCPECGNLNEMQIGQVELGFGGYHLDQASTMSHLSTEQKNQLKRYVESKTFYCDGCDSDYKVEVEVKDTGITYKVEI